MGRALAHRSPCLGEALLGGERRGHSDGGLHSESRRCRRGHGGVRRDAPPGLAAAQNYDVTALSLLRAGAGHSHVIPWDTALDVARKLYGEYGYITHHVRWLLEGAVAGEETLSAP